MLAACLAELALYVATISERPRAAMERRFRRMPLWMAASGVAPYLICTLPLGAFDWARFGCLAALAALISFWYVLLPRRPAVDLAFVAAVAAGLLLEPFDWIYPRPHPKLPMAILGQVMWTRLGILSALAVAHMPVKGFGPIPARGEWIAGIRNFILCVPVAAVLGWMIGFSRFRMPAAPAAAAATFLGMLWFVALREEFFFRGLLQEWTARWMRSDAAALAAVAIVFGAAHLSFREFPNWRFALMAAVAGAFYGRAYVEARSVRAAMVTHALVNTVWRTFFS